MKLRQLTTWITLISFVGSSLTACDPSGTAPPPSEFDYTRFLEDQTPVDETLDGDEGELWEVQWLPQSGRARVVMDRSRIHIRLPSDVLDVEHDSDTIYLLRPDGLSLVSRHDLSLFHEDDRVPFATLDLGGQSFSRQPEEIAVVEDRGSALIYFGVPDEEGNRLQLHPYVVRKAVRDESALSDAADESDAPDEDAPLGRGHAPGIIAYKAPSRPVLGRSVVGTIDPLSGRPVLLTLDRRGDDSVIHEYEAADPFEPTYSRTYRLESSAGRIARLEGTASPPGSLRAISVDHQSAYVSLSRLRALMATFRAYLLNRWAIEDGGAATKNFLLLGSWAEDYLGVGLLNTLVDGLDHAVGNPNLDLSLLAESEEIKKVSSEVSRQQVMDWARESGLFEQEQLEQIRSARLGQQSAGARWLVISTVFAYVAFRASALHRLAEAERSGLFDTLGRRAARVLRKAGLRNEMIERAASGLKSMQRRFRARIVRNSAAEQLPGNLMARIESRIEKFYRIEKTENGEVFLRTKRPRKADARVNRILDALDDISRAEASAAGNAARKKIFETRLAGNLEKSAQKNPLQIEALKTRLRGIEAEKQLKVARGRVLKLAEEWAALKEGRAPRPLRELTKSRSDDELLDTMEYMSVTGTGEIRKRSMEYLAELTRPQYHKLRERILPAAQRGSWVRRARQQLAEIEKLTSKKDRLDAAIGQWKTNGDVHPFFDVWARIASWHARMLLPESAYSRVWPFKTDTWNRYIRPDHVRVSSTHAEKVNITGKHARLALTTGSFDVSLDVVTQMLARANAVDPDERIIGSGKNHLELFEFGGREYGLHMDLIAEVASNSWGWTFSMPLSYARMFMNYGTKKRITHLRRLLDSQVKFLNPVNYAWGVANYWPLAYLSRNLVFQDYKRDQEALGNPMENCPFMSLVNAGLDDSADYSGLSQAERECREFAREIWGRSLNFTGLGNNLVFGRMAAVPYINPQYIAQAEFDQVAFKIFGNPWVGNLVSALVMPFTTGYGISRWAADYYGFNHPDTIAVMKKLRIDGILGKIDDNGYTDLTTWTHHELSLFFYMASLFTMEKEARENPIPEDASPAEVAEWYAGVFDKLFGGRTPDISELGLAHVRIAGTREETSARTAAPAFAAEAKRFRRLLDTMERGIAELPYRPAGRNEDLLAVESREFTGHDISREQFQRLLDQTTELNGALMDALVTLRENGRSTGRFLRTASAIATYDALALGYTFFLNPVISRKLGGLKRAWVKTAGRLTGKTGAALFLAGIPAAFWAHENSEAHLKVDAHTAELVAELQTIVLRATELLTQSYIQAAYRQINGQPVGLDPEALDEFEADLVENRDYIREFLTSTQAESRMLTTERRYRWHKIYSEYGPLGVGFFGSWLAARATLNKVSLNYLVRATDPYAKVFFGVSALAWFYAFQERAVVRDRIQLTSQDFFVLYQSWIATGIQLNLVRAARASVETGRPFKTDLEAVVRNIFESDPFSAEMESYRRRLLELAAAEDAPSLWESVRNFYENL